MPPFETTNCPEVDLKPVQTKANRKARSIYVFSCLILSTMVGVTIDLYYLGFMERSEIPNIYARALISIVSGILMPRILEYTESLSLSKLASRLLERSR